MQLTPAANQWTLYAARGLSLLWAGFWIWFGIASGIHENPVPSYIFMHTLPGLVFLAAALLAWKWERPGGWLLAGLALVIACLYLYLFRQRLGVGVLIAAALMLSLPPLITGVLYLVHSRRAQRV
jgi:hypothetical protein